jgi:hypothetical protein
MFLRASKKLGLDHAVLTKLESGGGEAPEDDHNVDEMLRLGAYGLVSEDEAEANRFCEADIDSILANRTRRLRVTKARDGKNVDVLIEPKPGIGVTTNDDSKDERKQLNYTKMKFQSEQADSKIDVTDPEFWTKFGGAGEFNRTSPDFLLAQLTDGSATKSDLTKYDSTIFCIDTFTTTLFDLTFAHVWDKPNRATFFRSLEDANKRIQASRKLGEDPPDLDDFINLLIQFSAMSSFPYEHRSRAERWLQEVEKRGERKARQQPLSSRAPPPPPPSSRRGRGGVTKVSESVVLTDTSSSSEEEENSSENEQVTEKRPRGRPPGSGNKQGKRGKLKKKGEDSEFEFESDDDDQRGKAKGKTGAKMNITICDKCDIAGALLQCEGDCARAFHLDCLDMDEPPPPTESWVCDECRTGFYACFACNKVVLSPICISCSHATV